MEKKNKATKPALVGRRWRALSCQAPGGDPLESCAAGWGHGGVALPVASQAGSRIDALRLLNAVVG